MKSIKKSTLEFLTELDKNNNKEWFHLHKDRYHAAKDNVMSFTQSLISGIARFDPDVKSTNATESIFRLYKDVRFARDKTPYKTHFGAFICKNGRKAGNAGYYIHIKPSDCMLAGGVYHPEPHKLDLIRKDIASNPQKIQRILANKNFKQQFGELEGDQLKTAPRGYAKDHPAIDLLRFKDYLVSQTIDDKMLTNESSFDTLLDSFKILKPLNQYLNQLIL